MQGLGSHLKCQSNIYNRFIYAYIYVYAYTDVVYYLLTYTISIYIFLRSDRSLLFVSMTLNDPGFTHFNFFDDNILKLRYHVPLQYPIAPCYIEIENKNIGNDIQK